MKLFKKQKSGDESYWKSFTDIMSGLVLIILLILMLLLLYVTQMNKEEHKYDQEYTNPTQALDDYEDNHHADEMYDRPPQQNDSGGGGGGGGEDDPGTKTNDGQYPDIGHDKTAVFVTVIDEETKKVIKKAGIRFELYAEKNASGGLQTLHTYYPEKIEYRQYETTEAGTFFLPEKITNGWYSLHNLRAPKGYGFAEDVNFEVKESLDWPEPLMVSVPMSPAKGIIYVQNRDAETKQNVAGVVYEAYAAEDILTLDGTLRYHKNEKVAEFTSDKNGRAASPKLYYGNYTVTQKEPAAFYSINNTPLNVELAYSEKEEIVYDVACQKTKVRLTLLDDQTAEPIAGAVVTVTGRDNVTTDEAGVAELTDFDKGATYTLTLSGLPKPYHIKKPETTFKVDAGGLIEGRAVYEIKPTAYIIRLSASVTDMLFGNEITTTTIRLFDDQNKLVDEWEGTGATYEIEDLSPGTYTLEVNGQANTRQSITLKDEGGLQTVHTSYWTLWDTIAVIGAALVLGLLIMLAVSLLRRRKKKKSNE